MKNELPFSSKEAVGHKPIRLIVLIGHPPFLLSISKQLFSLFIETIKKLRFYFLCSCIMYNNKGR